MGLSELLNGDPAAMTKDYEGGFQPNIYLDSEDNKTIGYGFNIDDPVIAQILPPDVVAGRRPITRPEAEEAFKIIYANAADDAVSYIGGQENFERLPPQAQNVLVDMSYNLGLPKLNEFEETRKAALRGDMNTMAAEMVDSDWYGQTGRRSRDHVKTIRGLAK